jgi:hypothetical protein
LYFYPSVPSPVTSKTNATIGTYGGHLELSAFAHLTQQDVKVIQPGPVYVIEWAAGGAATTTTTAVAEILTQDTAVALLDERDKRQLRRDQKKGGVKVER